MLKRLRTRSPEIYCAVTALLFMAVSLIAAMPLSMSETMNDNIRQILLELPCICLVLLFLSKTSKLELVTRRGCSFLRGLIVGLYLIALIAQSLASSILYGISADANILAPWLVIAFFISRLMIGVSEEFYFRGVFAETLLEKFGTGKAGVYKACMISSVVFAVFHILNLFAGHEPIEVLSQCINAFVVSIMITAIYFRSGNLWVIAFIHGLYDIASGFIGNVYDVAPVSNAVTAATRQSALSVILSALLSSLLYLIPALFLLRDSKIEQVEQHFGEDCRSFAASRAALQE